MNVQEMEKLTGLERANIRYYEKEGLLKPEREKNGYRNYSEEDKETLLKIKLLRELGVSLAEIRDLQEGRVKMVQVMTERVMRADQEVSGLHRAKELCEKIGESRTSYAELNAEAYLASWEIGRSDCQRDSLKGPAHPWHRYFARGLDFSVYALLWSLIETYLLNWYPQKNAIISAIMGMVLMLLIEPLLITSFQTTLGKWVFGIRLKKEDGKKFLYGEALERTRTVLVHGMLLGIPLVGWVTMWDHKQYYETNGYVDWDKGIDYRFEERSVGQLVLLYIGVVVVLEGCGWLTERQATLPNHRGGLSIEAFADNFNGLTPYYYDNYFAWTRTEAGLNSDGEWVRVKPVIGSWADVSNQKMIYMNDEGTPLPAMAYQLKGGDLSTIKMEVSWNEEENWNGYGEYLPLMRIAAAAFAGAEKDVTAWNGGTDTILKLLMPENATYQVGEVKLETQYDKDESGNCRLSLIMTKK